MTKDINDVGGISVEDSEPVSTGNTDRPKSILYAKFKSLGEWGKDDSWLGNPPPPRKYLLETKIKDERRGVTEPVGFLPQGRVGMLAAAGGVGKSWALIQLAVSVATGKSWFGLYDIVESGKVVLALAEEEESEVRRRIYAVAKALSLTDDEKILLEENLIPLPLCGDRVALSGAESAEQETPFFEDLSKHLKQTEGSGWKLVVLDPLSRFAGQDTEVSNYSATEFITAVERLTSSPGSPTVLLTHHTNQSSRKGKTDSTSARGVTALFDGIRWSATLEAEEGDEPEDWSSPKIITLRFTKSNYGRNPPAAYLCRNPQDGGALSRASRLQTREYMDRIDKKKEKKSTGRGQPKRESQSAMDKGKEIVTSAFNN